MSKHLERVRQRLEELNATEEIELSGIGLVEIKSHVRLEDLALAGHIPVTLLTELQNLSKKAQKNPAKAGDALAKMTPALDAVAIAAFVDPPVTKDGDADSLAVGDIPPSDKLAVFMRVNREAAALQPFRLEGGQSNGIAHSGDGVQPAAVGDSGDS
jgi:hypothetical protein